LRRFERDIPGSAAVVALSLSRRLKNAPFPARKYGFHPIMVWP
jgi:hypothetical protein